MPPAKSEAPADGDRCATGVEGLDSILSGGIPRGNTVLVTGSVGTGKTSLSVEFLLHGARGGENSLYVSVTESSEKLIQNLVRYDYFEPRLVKEGRLIFIDLPLIYHRLGLEKAEFDTQDVAILIKVIVDLVREMRTKRLVIDSVTSVCYRLKDPEKIRQFILDLGTALSGLGCTTLLVSEISPTADRYSLFGVEEAIADGIVIMSNYERRGDLLRTLQVVKMRGTTHSRAKYVLDLTPVGVLLVPLLKGGSVSAG